MTSGDRGGIKAIIDLIKKTKIPIVCICNDRYCEKIRSLVNYCLDIKFQKPDRQLIAKRIRQIASIERVSITDRALSEIITGFQSDIRQIISYVEHLSKYVTSNITESTLNEDSLKDSSVMLTPFDVCKKLMNQLAARSLTLNQKMNYFFTDSDKIPLLIQENYLDSASKARNNGLNQLNQLRKAAQSISFSSEI